jgi:trans-aconitate 2-methyltransferase
MNASPILRPWLSRPLLGGHSRSHPDQAVDAWQPAQYQRFADARLRPALELMERIALEAPAAIYDLGCGDGRTTDLLARRWPKAKVVGVDSSPRMLASARQAFPRHAFLEADLAHWSPGDPADLLFSNAALHWLDDHPGLFRRLIGLVRPGGWIAVQMPRNHDQPSHTAILEAAEAGPWREKLRPLLRPSPVFEPARYHSILAPQARHLDIWETVYFQLLEGENPVAEWVKGSALGPLLAALKADERTAFEAAYRALVAKAYPKAADGSTPFPFRRLFILAERCDRG